MITKREHGAVAARCFSLAFRSAVARACLGALVLIGPGKRLLAGAAFAVCAGDCTAGGAVTVADTIVLASIALGEAEPALCPSGIPPGRTADITLILEAVDNALGGCAPASTATPTATTVPTMTPTATPSAAGTWTETQLALASSDCNSETAGIVEQVAAAQPPSCDYQVSQVGTAVHAVDCQGSGLDGTVDSTGMVLFVQPAQSETFDNGCTFTLSGTVAVDTSRSPTTAAYTVDLSFSGPCSPFASCTAHLQSRWTKH